MIRAVNRAKSLVKIRKRKYIIEEQTVSRS